MTTHHDLTRYKRSPPEGTPQVILPLSSSLQSDALPLDQDIIQGNSSGLSVLTLWTSGLLILSHHSKLRFHYTLCSISSQLTS